MKQHNEYKLNSILYQVVQILQTFITLGQKYVILACLIYLWLGF